MAIDRTSLRKALARPMGPLFPGLPTVSLPLAIEWMKSKHPSMFQPGQESELCITCVGDVISQGMLVNPVLASHVKICLIDGETQRGQKTVVPLTAKMITKTMTNPRGTISKDALPLLKQFWLQSDPILLQVIGEEDLLVIPAVIAAPENTFIFYGQPPVTDLNPPIQAGCVGMFVDAELKQRCEQILSLFQ